MTLEDLKTDWIIIPLKTLDIDVIKSLIEGAMTPEREPFMYAYVTQPSAAFLDANMLEPTDLLLIFTDVLPSESNQLKPLAQYRLKYKCEGIEEL